MEIHNSDDYDKFYRDPRNRPIDEAHVIKLVTSIKRSNHLNCFPIVVSSDFCIFDGQHRHAAARLLKVPFFYVINDDFRIGDVGHVNHAAKNWGWNEFLHFHSESGNMNYLKLKAVLEAHSFLTSVSTVSRFFYRESQLNFDNKFFDGKYVFSDELANSVIQAFDGFRQFNSIKKLLHLSTFQKAVAQVVRHPEYDHERMMSKLEYLGSRIQRCYAQKEYVEVFEHIYNYRHSEANRVKFTVR